MAELKTKATNQSVTEFLNAVQPEEKRRDSFTILEMMRRITGEKPIMWGMSIIGFGKYHYKSERSTQEGDWPLIGFSPRKTAMTLYLMEGFTDHQKLLKILGTYKASVGCLYIKRMSDIDRDILKKLIRESYINMKKIHT